ncbi:MAG: class I SAM-dependent methyltransferase [Acidobacteria bacterium]|nr:class I SAM-dependent methyltransferase [Acidobacteriota bacterium]
MDYSPEFYRRLRGPASDAAHQIVPWLVESLRPSSVVDVGCGSGTWLRAFDELGVHDLLGIDGHLGSDVLDISRKQYHQHDLRGPIRLQRRFDLVMSLEVAEHLPPASARGFVESLASLGDIVAFSAAVPGQGGTQHVNEQWPEYWSALFDEQGYRAFDCFRSRFWLDERIAWWYRQNLFLYVAESRLNADPTLRERLRSSDVHLPPRLIHPAMHLAHVRAMADVQKVLATVQSLAAQVPTAATLILIDEDKLRAELSAWSSMLPFLEKDGRYNGKPADSTEAIRELERLRELGAEFVALTGATFWWLDHYKAFGAHLSNAYDLRCKNENLMVFDLRKQRVGLSGN